MVMLMILSVVCPVRAEKVRIDRELLEKILQRQDMLEKEVERLKEQVREKKGEKTPPVTAPSAEDIQYMKEDAEDMSERLDTVERKSILDKVRLGGDFRVRMDSFRYHDHEFNGQKENGSTDELWSTRFRLSLRTDISDDMVFHASLNYFKLWGDSNFDDGSPVFDMFYPSIPDAEGNLHVERAYVDYFVPETPLSLTFGRLPLNEGPPNELRDHTSRKGTWPKVVYDGEGDGILMNLSLDKWTGLKNAMFRLGYYKLFQNYQKYKGVKIDDWRGYVASFETDIPGIRDSFFWMGYTRTEDIMPVYDVSPIYPEDFGDLDYYNVHLQFGNIMNSGLDGFFSIAWSHISPSSEGTVLTPAYEAGVYGDTLHGDLGKSRNAHCIYTGLRYELPVEFLKYPCLGLEYNYGSKYWLGTAAASGDIVSKLVVNGNAYELYYIQPIHEKHMFFRIGAIYMDYDYYNPMYYIGSQPESDMSLLNFYFLTHVRF